ncbi:MAG: 2-C-methyl-D-erythritol 4-phosphate cytidylyltransferase [Burkholderiaceae bacterium]
MTSRCFALLPAGGTGSRAGTAIPKQYLAVAGKPMIVHTLAAFSALPMIDRITVVIARDDRYFDTLVLDDAIRSRLDVVRAGGSTRDASVANGLAAMGGKVDGDDWILVHDAARCGITPALIATLIESLQGDAIGGLLALPLDDTVKREASRAFDGRMSVAQTVDRHGLWRAQTPQMFRHRMLGDAIAAARARGHATTDEAGAIEAAGHRVLLVRGSPRNFKVTTADDLAMMDRLLQADHATTHPSASPR